MNVDMNTPFAYMDKARNRDKRAHNRRESSGGNQNKNKEYPQYAGISKKEPTVLRMFGRPCMSPEREPYDSTYFLMSKLVSEDGGSATNLIWKLNEETLKPDFDWFLTKLFFHVHSKVKDTGEYKYKDLELFNVFNKDGNGNKIGKGFQNTFWPGLRVVYNVIDRQDDWCKKNRKAKLISDNWYVKDVDIDGNVQHRMYATPGINSANYDKLKNVMDKREDKTKQDLPNFDVVFDPIQGDKITYNVTILHSEFPSDIKARGNTEPLTVDEAGYLLHNLDYFRKPSTYYKIQRAIGKERLKKYDRETGSNWSDKLQDLVDQEKDAYEKSDKTHFQYLVHMNINRDYFYLGLNSPDNANVNFQPIPKTDENETTGSQTATSTTTHTETQSSQPVNTQEQSSSEPAFSNEVNFPEERQPAPTSAPAERQRSSVENTTVSVSDYFSKLPNWEKLTPEEKQITLNWIVKIENNVPQPPSGEVGFPCDNADCKWPGTELKTFMHDDVYNCPVCGQGYKPKEEN